MARVTVEDCVQLVPNRFELVLLAAQRARKIGAGGAPLVERDNDKNPVIALREIADEKVEPDVLKEELLRSNQRVIEMDDEEDVIDQTDGEEEWSAIAAQRASEGMGEFAGIDDNDEEEADDGPSLEDLAGAPAGEDA